MCVCVCVCVCGVVSPINKYTATIFFFNKKFSSKRKIWEVYHSSGTLYIQMGYDKVLSISKYYRIETQK